jgi:hypothetical protein
MFNVNSLTLNYFIFKPITTLFLTNYENVQECYVKIILALGYIELTALEQKEDDYIIMRSEPTE